MSFDFGDMNNDGRVDYVDQKIFDTQINPYSGEYEGPPVTTSHFDGRIILYIIIGAVAMLVIGFIDEHIGFFAQFLPAIVILFIIPWKKIKRTELPFASPTTTVIPVAGIVILVWLIINLYRRMVAGDYYDFSFFVGRIFGNYLSMLLGVILLSIACKKKKYKMFLWGILFFGSTAPLLLSTIVLNPGIYLTRGYILGILSLASYLLTVISLILPEKRALSICAFICSVLWLVVGKNLIAIFMGIVAFLVFFCNTGKKNNSTAK